MAKINVFLKPFPAMCFEMAPFAAHLTEPLRGYIASTARQPQPPAAPS
jgi:hypothetical protein